MHFWRPETWQLRRLDHNHEWGGEVVLPARLGFTPQNTPKSIALRNLSIWDRKKKTCAKGWWRSWFSQGEAHRRRADLCPSEYLSIFTSSWYLTQGITKRRQLSRPETLKGTDCRKFAGVRRSPFRLRAAVPSGWLINLTWMRLDYCTSLCSKNEKACRRTFEPHDGFMRLSKATKSLHDLTHVKWGDNNCLVHS
jgi:hypothetical protein